MTKPASRIASIDILRGLDLFFLLFLQPVLLSIGSVYDAPWYQSLLYQLDHEVWEGFRCWDLVMPLFLFMVGASMPFSFSKYLKSPSLGRKALYLKILRRFLLLFFLGMIVQGNLLAFSLDRLRIYNNTLQAIAFGYLIAAFILLATPSLRVRIILTFALLILYSVPMLIYGSYLPADSFAFAVDRAVIGPFRGDLTYTWIWSSLTFGASVMFGALSGLLIKNRSHSSPDSIPLLLLLFGILFIACGWTLGAIEPVIKRLWTSTMTLYSTGWSMLLLAFFYWLVDILKCRRGLQWLKIYGMNAITAYCIGEVISFRSIVISITYGLQPILAEWYPVLLVFGNALILFLILRLMYNNKVFLKI